MIAKSSIKVPWNHRPFLGTVPVERQKMILVEAVPMLHQDAGCEIIDILIHIQPAGKEIEQVRSAREVVAKGLQVSQAFLLLGGPLVMTLEGCLRAKIALVG